MTPWLDAYVLACSIFCVMGLIVRWSTPRVHSRARSMRPAQRLISEPKRSSFRSAWLAATVRPWATFHRRTDRLWAVGYALYHVAIVLVVLGYATALGIIALRFHQNHPLPSFLDPSPRATRLSISNLMLWVFGNADTTASRVLFGQSAPVFRAVAWLELPLALAGNTCLLVVATRARVGAIRRGIDSVSEPLRYQGRFSGQRLLVRLLILSIIALEFAGRFDSFRQAAVYHTVVAFTLIALIPVTYLTHIPLAPLALWQAVSRRRLNRVV
jgi:hypothetical protein